MKKLITAALLTATALTLTGCASDADRASENLSKAAEQFEVERRVVFLNGITDTYLLSIEGRCSIEDDGSDFSAWSDASVAQDDWEGGHQVIEVDVRSVLLPGDDPHAPIELDALTIHLCDEHAVSL